MHFIIQPLLRITVGQIIRELPCNSRFETFLLRFSSTFQHLQLAGPHNMSQPQIAMPTKDSMTDGLQCCVSPRGGDRHTQAGTEMHFIKATHYRDWPLYCTLLATLLTSTQATIIPLVSIVLVSRAKYSGTCRYIFITHSFF